MRARIDCRAPRVDARAVSARAEAAGKRALLRAGERVRVRSIAIAPRRSGRLIASARVDSEAGKVTVRYGAAYAAIQHEHTEFHHPNGGRAKYLRDAIEDPAAAQEILHIVSEELRAAL